MKKILLLTALTLPFSSCAALTRYKCNREYAVKKGMEDAAAGLLSQPSRQDGSSCEGEYTGPTFSKDYQYGFQQKKQEICQVSGAAQSGRTDGETGLTARPQKTKYNLCTDSRDHAKMENAYEKEFTKAFCSTARAAKAGTARAQAWEDSDFDSAFADCRANAGPMKRAYHDAYKQTIALSCTLPEAERAGAAQAQAGRPISEGLTRLERCGNSHGDLKGTFQRSYLNAKDQAERAEAIRLAEEGRRLREQRASEFQASVATANFLYQLRGYNARCSVSPDRSYVQVEVENAYSDQVLIQGNWRVIYYGADFNKITEDRTTEAVLLTGHNRKSFQKMTLPRDAAYCRAEFLGVN